MEIIEKYSQSRSDESVRKTISSLEKNGIKVLIFDSEEEAKKAVLELIPEGAEVMNMTSVTLDTVGISDYIVNSGKYNSVRRKINSLDKKTEGRTIRKLRPVADYTVGSIQAVTENGEIMIASDGGSQLAAYAYGTGKAIWVVGTQKIVKNLDEGFERIYKYCEPLESERQFKLYNAPTIVEKILIITSDVPGRLTLIFVRQNLGY